MAVGCTQPCIGIAQVDLACKNNETYGQGDSGAPYGRAYRWHGNAPMQPGDKAQLIYKQFLFNMLLLLSIVESTNMRQLVVVP